MSSTDKQDLEADKIPKEHLVGFADLAEYISSDGELSIYRKFGSLGARNILYFQAELQVLESKLKQLDEEDKAKLVSLTGNEKKQLEFAARAWESFEQQAKASNERQKRKMDLVLRVREVMKDYEEALLRRSQVLALEHPNGHTLKAFTNWFRHQKPLRGSNWHLLDDESDLVALKVEQDSDRLSGLIRRYFGYYIKERSHVHPQSWGPIYYFPAKRVAWVVSILGIVISSTLLVGAIVALYYESRMGRRLGITGCFTFVFATTVGLLTNAKKSEIFAATAAYAAVLAVFLSVPLPG